MSFTAFVSKLPIDLSYELKKELKQFEHLFEAANDIEYSENTNEFINKFVNSAIKKQDMLDVFDRVFAFIEISRKVSIRQLSKLYDIKLTLQESIEQSSSVNQSA